MIGVNTVRVDLEVWIAIRPENARQGSTGNNRPGFGVSAGVEIDLRLFGDQGAIFFHTGFDFALDRVTAAGRHRFRDALHNPDGALRFSRQGNHQRLDFSSRLAAVGAPDEIHMDADFRQRIMKNLRDLLAYAERVTGRSPDTDAVAIDLRDGRVRFHGIVIDHRKLERVFEDLIRLGKTLFHVSLNQLSLETDISLGKIVNARCVVGHCLIDVDDRG